MEFAIDGIEMPRPSEWKVDPKPVSENAERLIGNGKAVVPYLTTAYEVTWTYKYLKKEQYDLIYDTYIRKTTKNKSMYHTLITKDSNSDDILTLEIYTQSDFSAPLYRIRNGIREYKDVKFVFVSLGGDE